MKISSNSKSKFLVYGIILIFSLFITVFSYNKFMHIVYPVKYQDIVSESCEKYGVEPELVYAIIKSESNFDENAKSAAGAYGLMQITADTFKWLQIYTGDSNLSIQDLLNPQININYGTMLISMLKNKYFSEEVALCAYNAGMSTVDKWLKDEKYTENGEELSFVPYKETRDYALKVSETKFIYKNLYFRNTKVEIH